MKTQDLIEKINFLNFTTLEKCVNILKLEPVYANYMNEQKFGPIKIGSLVFKCDDGYVIARGLEKREELWNEAAVGCVTAMEYVKKD